MSDSKHPALSLAVGVALAGGLGLSGAAFAMTDLAQGYMLASEAKGAHAHDHAVGGHHTLEQIDTDKNGTVSREEFAAAHGGDASKFARYDTDGDGAVTAAEMKAAHEGKCGEGKCGEGKCGAAGGEKKAGAEADGKAAAEGKCGEGKCGEGKCGGMA